MIFDHAHIRRSIRLRVAIRHVDLHRHGFRRAAFDAGDPRAAILVNFTDLAADGTDLKRGIHRRYHRENVRIVHEIIQFAAL